MNTKLVNIKFSGKVCSAILVGFLAFQSCSYLDVSDEIAQSLTIEEAFENPSYVKRWHAGLFNCISEFSYHAGGANNGFTGIWNQICGEMINTSGPTGQIMVAGFNGGESSYPLQRWWTLYKQIRAAMLFIDHAHPVGGKDDSIQLNMEEVERMKADAKYLIAYSYFSLFELYGPVPFLDTVASTEEKQFNYYRTPIDVFLAKVDNLLIDVIESNALPQTPIVDYTKEGSERYNMSEIVRPTKIAALALRAKLWVYAASPLFNGGYEESLSLRNSDGSQIFSPYDGNKWIKAKECLENLFDEANSLGHKLYVITDEDGNIDADRSIYELFQIYNDEILWATGVNYYNSGSSGGMDANTRPRNMKDGWGHSCVTQMTVDAFFDKNGLCIDDANSVYNENMLTDVVNPCNENRMVDKDIYGMYANREPRFYADVIYEGKSWHIQPWDDFYVAFAKGEPADNSNANSPRTGYVVGKFKNRTCSQYGDHIRSWARPSILFRLADFYLYYAEVLNEIDPSNPNIITYLDKVRHRAGILGYKELQENGMKDIVGNQEKQREAIHHERQVELFCEGTRYFDVRRWMVCDQGQEGDQTAVYGMNMNGKRWSGNKPGPFYNRTLIEKRAWTRAMYLLPIPDEEVNKDILLVQNPLW